jgi:hypothetical protein
MKYQLVHHGWPIEGGAKLIPVGTVLDGDDWTWQGSTLPQPPPINCIALDQSAYDELLKHYPYYPHLILSGPDVLRRHGDPPKVT